jgi:hypothetical protein
MTKMWVDGHLTDQRFDRDMNAEVDMILRDYYSTKVGKMKLIREVNKQARWKMKLLDVVESL